jgi:hypothetical protein
MSFTHLLFDWFIFFPDVKPGLEGALLIKRTEISVKLAGSRNV